jgi:hypothetical protein
MNLPFYERIKSYDSNSQQWRMVTQFPLELLNELRKVDGDGSGLDANFLQGRTVNDIIQLAKDGSFTLPSGFIFIGDTLGNATARALSGDATLQNTGALILASTGVTAGTYNLASLTIDAKGRITNAVSYTINVNDIPELPQSKITGLVTDLSNRELLANKENSVIDTSTTKYPTVNLLKIGLDGKQNTLVSGTNIKTLNGDSLLGSGNITIISENLATNNLTQSDSTRDYNMGTGNRVLRWLAGTVEKIIFHTDGGNPTLTVNKTGNGQTARFRKISGTGDAVDIEGGVLDMNNNKIVNVTDPTSNQDVATKNYVDTKPDTNLANTNLSIPSATNRTLTIPSDSDLSFVNSLRLKTTGNQSLTQFAQIFNTSVDDAEMVNNSIAPLLDNTSLDLFWKYKNNMGVVSDLFAKVDKSKVYGGTRYTLIKSNGTQEYYTTLSQVRLNWVDGDVLHQFADETSITYVNNGSGIMFAIPSIVWIGNGFKTTVNSININSGNAFNIASGKTAYFLGVNLNSEGINITTTLSVVGTLYNDDNCIFRIFIQLARSSSTCVAVTGLMFNGTVIPDGVTDSANLYPNGLAGTGTCFNVTTRGFQLGAITNFIKGYTNYPCATNFRSSYCDFGDIAIGNGRIFDFCEIRSTRNNNGTANFQQFTARHCNIIHTPSLATHTFYNIPNIILINCTFITTGYLCASFGGSAGWNIIKGGYMAFANQTNFAANNYAGLVEIRDCTIEATNASATTDVLVFTNVASTNVKINNVTFINPNGRSDIRTIPANNVEWKNCRFSKGNSHISVSSGTVADAINNNPARLTDPLGFLNNTGNGNWFMYVPMTTAERDALTNVSAGFQIRNTTTNFLQVYNGSTWKDLLDLT